MYKGVTSGMPLSAGVDVLLQAQPAGSICSGGRISHGLTHLKAGRFFALP